MADRDPAIDEIRAVRRRISAEHGHDIRSLLRYYKEMEKDYADRIVRTHPPARTDGPPWTEPSLSAGTPDRAGPGDSGDT